MKTQTIVIGMLAVAISAMAQYSIPWSTLDGGGQRSMGGSFRLHGTAGQHDADSMAGGSYLIQGGFWVPSAVQVAGAPWLDIMASGGTNVIVSWLPADPGWVLQEAFNLQSNWVDSVSGSTNPISIPATEAAQFYRLREL